MTLRMFLLSRMSRLTVMNVGRMRREMEIIKYGKLRFSWSRPRFIEIRRLPHPVDVHDAHRCVNNVSCVCRCRPPEDSGTHRNTEAHQARVDDNPVVHGIVNAETIELEERPMLDAWTADFK